MQTSVMLSPYSKTQSLRTFSPVAAQVLSLSFCPLQLCPLSTLQQTFIQPSLNRLQSYQTLHFLNSPSSRLPLPPASWFTRPISHLLTACQCGCFCPHPVLLLSNDCSILVKSSSIFPLYLSHRSSISLYLLSCMQNTQYSSRCALTHTALSPPFSFQKLANVPLVFFVFFCLLSV